MSDSVPDNALQRAQEAGHTALIAPMERALVRRARSEALAEKP